MDKRCKAQYSSDKSSRRLQRSKVSALLKLDDFNLTELLCQGFTDCAPWLISVTHAPHQLYRHNLCT